jgi:hypothetical protein
MGGRLSGRVNGGRNTRARRRVLLDMVSVIMGCVCLEAPEALQPMGIFIRAPRPFLNLAPQRYSFTQA